MTCYNFRLKVKIFLKDGSAGEIETRRASINRNGKTNPEEVASTNNPVITAYN